MRILKHLQNRDDRRHLVRMAHLWVYPDEDREALAEFGAELVVSRKPVKEFSAKLHFGTRSSETPIDAHLTVAGTGVYVSTGVGRAPAHWLTRGEGRDLALAMHNGQLWWKLWTSDEHCSGPAHQHWVAGKYQPWRCREGNMQASPLDWALGKRKNEREAIAEAEVLVAMPEAVYEVQLKLEKWFTRRVKSAKRRYSHASVDWSARPGIPWRYDSSGGWKGTEVYGSSVRIPDGLEDKDWPAVAAALITAEAVKNRVASGWTPEHQASVSL